MLSKIYGGGPPVVRDKLDIYSKDMYLAFINDQKLIPEVEL